MSEQLVNTHNGYTILNRIIPEDPSNPLVQDTYSLWAKTYEKDMSHTDSHGPYIMADEVALFYGDRRDIRILDLASGTGLVGKSIHAHGFKMLDAVDGNGAMLAEAERSGVFSKCYQEMIGPNKLPIADGSYDAIVSTNSFTPSHLNGSCFEELNRLTKAGGHIFILMFADYFKDGSLYGKQLASGMAELERNGTWKRVLQKTREDYFKGGDGILFVFENC